MRRSNLLTILCLLLGTAPVAADPLAIYCEDAPPFQMRAADGTLTGLAIEVVQKVQKQVGSRDGIEMVPWSRGYDAVLNQPSAVLFCMTRTAAREPLFQWVGPLHETVFALYARADSPLVLKTLQDAKSLSAIGVYAKDVRDQYLTAQGFTNLQRAYDFSTSLKRLAAGQLDVYVGSQSEIATEARAAGFKREDFKEVFPLFRAQTYLAFSKGTPAAVVQAWQKALDGLKQDGTFEAIYHRYLPANPVPGPALPPR